MNIFYSDSIGDSVQIQINKVVFNSLWEKFKDRFESEQFKTIILDDFKSQQIYLTLFVAISEQISNHLFRYF